MRKSGLLVVAIGILLVIFGYGCWKYANEKSVEEPIAEPVVVTEAERYITSGRYYEEGYVVDSNGERWDYECDKSDFYDGIPVKVVMSDNGTQNLYDDVVLGLVYDRETAIYDELEESFSEVEDWEVSRDGNDIHISVKVEE